MKSSLFWKNFFLVKTNFQKTFGAATPSTPTLKYMAPIITSMDMVFYRVLVIVGSMGSFWTHEFVETFEFDLSLFKEKKVWGSELLMRLGVQELWTHQLKSILRALFCSNLLPAKHLKIFVLCVIFKNNSYDYLKVSILLMKNFLCKV